MPPTGANTRVKDPEYKNWLAVGLALNYLKNGLHSFIQGELDAMHQTLLQKLYGVAAVPIPRCSHCKYKDAIQNRRTHVWKFRSPCPSGLCDVWLTELMTLHTNPPSIKIYLPNCDVTAWPFVPWECAKLYMPGGQPPSNTGPAMSDSHTLLTLMANCTYFHGKLSLEGLALTRKVTKIRNIVMHSGNLKLTDDDRKSFMMDIIHLLEDPTHLISLKECKEAVDEINRINDDSLDVFFNLDIEMKALVECVNDCRKELEMLKDTEKMEILKDTKVMVESLKEESTESSDMVVEVSSDIQEVKTILSQARDQVPTENIDSGEASIPYIPEEIQSMTPEAVELYLNILKTGVERRKDIRLMLVGLYNTGKTSLARRLMDQDIQNTESTDGIQIYRGRCRISLQDGTWTASESDVNDDASSRLVMLAVMLAVQSMEKRILELKEISKEDTVVAGSVDTGRNDSSEENPSLKLDQVMRTKMIYSPRDPSDIKNIKKLEQRLNCSTPEQAVQKKDEAIVNIWDFAGQFAYYSTHQLFLSPRAIYIVVFKLNEDMKDLITNDDWVMDARGRKDHHIRAGCMFWLKSICHYGQSHSMQKNVILVGTHKDKLEGSEDDKEQYIEKTFESIHMMLSGNEVAEIVHEKIFAVSNLVDDQQFQELCQTILEMAKAQDYWDEKLPAKWIQLEGRLMDERAKKKCMLSFQEMLEIDKSCSSPMGDEDELKLFLTYQTQIGNLIFIDEYSLQDTIVLDPQWIADAFCSAVADKRFAGKFGKLKDAWTKMTQTAVMEESLLAKLWSEKNQQDFVIHQQKLVQYMEKLNMMAKIKVISDDGLEVEELPEYFIPCLLKECPDRSVGCCPNEERYPRTAILCFEFSRQFLPPAVFHRLLSVCIAKWPVAKQGRKFLLFCGYGVFEIFAGSNRCRLTIQQLDDIIAVRMSSVSTGTRMLDANFCDRVRRFIRVVLNQEFQRFRKVFQGEEPFEQKILCPTIKDIHLSSDHRCGLISVEDVVKNHVEELYSCVEHSDMSYPHDVKIKDILQHWFPDELASVVPASEQGQRWCLDVQEDRIVTEKELSSISSLIGNEWEFLGRALGISDVELEQIKEDYQKTRERIYQMLKTWKELSAKKTTISELMSAIQNSHIVVDKDKIKNIFDGTLASIGSNSGPKAYTPSKESARTMTSSSCQPTMSKAKEEKLPSSLDDSSAAAANDKVIQMPRRLFCPYDTFSGNMKAQIDETDAVWNQTLRVQLAKSVGIIKSPYGSFGTGFRVGSDCIMTAKHVKDSVLNAVPFQSLYRTIHLSNAFIDFSYEVNGAPDADNLKFYFKPEIVYENADMDTVILRLQSSTQTYPPPLTFAELSYPCGMLYFIGHSRADIKKTDKFCCVKLMSEDKTAAEKWSVNHVGVNGYNGIDNPRRMLFHCTFEQGASGSPGVWIYLENLQAHAKVVTMLLCGYPYWYYESACPQKKKDATPKDFCVEQGVCIRSLSEDMKVSKPDLWKEIFFENSNDDEDVEMKSV